MATATQVEPASIGMEIPIPIFGHWERFRVTIKSETPLLMNRVSEEAIEGMSQSGPRGRTQSKRPSSEEKAARAAYHCPNGNLGVPKECIYSMLFEGANTFRIGKVSLRPIILSAIKIEEDFLDLGTKKYAVEDKTVVIKKARIPGGRARLDEWGGTFHMLVDTDVVSGVIQITAADKKKKQPAVKVPAIAALLEWSFSRIGLLDHRPLHKGRCGLSHVVKLERLD